MKRKTKEKRLRGENKEKADEKKLEGQAKENAEGQAEGLAEGDAGDKTGQGRVIDRKVLEARRKQRIRRRRIIALIVLVLIIAAVIILLWRLGVFKKRDPDKVLTPSVTQVEYTPRGEYIMSAVDGTVVICDENGVTGIDTDGKWKWNSTLSAFNPVFSGEGDVILVTDQGGKSIWAFNGSGQLWRYISENDLICAYIAGPVSGSGGSSRSSENGPDIITICEQEDFESSVTLLHTEKGKLVEKFTRKFGKYHMLSASESSDRSQLASAGVYYEGGVLTGCTVFLRTSDGEMYSTLVSDGEVYLQLRYLSDGTLFEANSDSLRLVRRTPSVSGSGDTEKVLWTRSGDRKLIVDTGVIGKDKFAAAFSDGNSSGGGMSYIKFYDRNGNVTKTSEILGSVKGMEILSGFLTVWTDKTVYLLNQGGNIIGTSEFESAISGASFMDTRTLAVNTAAGIFILSFSE
ncbi:MAG: hypothetical protein J5950_05300 [Clostridia bacterium]|nr:hypothetical protein [Clostridia bacterium]